MKPEHPDDTPSTTKPQAGQEECEIHPPPFRGRLSDRHPRGFIAAPRGEVGLQLLRASKNAFVMLYVIAQRAQRTDTFNRHDLKPGEALLGDYDEYDMSKQEYRTAKRRLAKWGFATFRPTPSGTTARLVDSRVFDINGEAPNTLDNTLPTPAQHPANTRPTPTKNGRTGKNAENAGNPPCFLEEGSRGESLAVAGTQGRVYGQEAILREKELERVEARLKRLQAEAGEDASGTRLYSNVQKAERTRLRARREELKKALGLVV